MAEVNEAVINNNGNASPPHTEDPPENVLTSHLLKIDFPLVSQEYREACKHYLGTMSEKVYPNGYLTIKTKVDHYLYTLNISNEIGKPLLSDIVRFPQEVLTSYNNNESNKSEDAEEHVAEDVKETKLKHLQIRSNFKLVKNCHKRNRSSSKKSRKKFKRDNEESSASSEEESDSQELPVDYCACTDAEEDDIEEYEIEEEDSDSSDSCCCNE